MGGCGKQAVWLQAFLSGAGTPRRLRLAGPRRWREVRGPDTEERAWAPGAGARSGWRAAEL